MRKLLSEGGKQSTSSPCSEDWTAMARGPALWLGPLLLVSLWASSAPGRRSLRVRQGLLRGPCLTPSPPCPTASLLRRLAEHMQQFQESSSLGLSLGPGAVALPKEGWLEQPLDPFNASDRRSFLQVRPAVGGPLPTLPSPQSPYSAPQSLLSFATSPSQSPHLIAPQLTLCLLSGSLTRIPLV